MKKMLSVSSLILSALISCENGMSTGTSYTSDVSMASRTSKKSEKTAGTFFQQSEKRSGPQTVKPEGMEKVFWEPEKEIIQLKNTTAEVSVSGLKAGDVLYLIKANVSDEIIPAEYTQYVRSTVNVTGTKDASLYENLKRLYTGTELKFTDPKRADPWEVPDKKTQASGKT